MATPNIFLTIVFEGKTLQGESEIERYKDAIAVDSLRWESSATHRPTDGDTVTTEFRPGNVTLGKVFDRSSGVLYGHMVDRKAFDSALISVVDMTLGLGEPQPILEFKLTGGHVESISTKATESGSFIRIGEDLTLSFRGGELRYFADPVGNTARRRFTLPFVISSQLRSGT